MNLGPREQRPMQRLPDGACYIGEWKVGTQKKEGRGMMVWKDGAMYEGYYKNDKGNFFGRIIHADGDVYQGEFVED